ncbi:hypothetical protein ACA910_004234 [Epithemia clementina (nom. ined.)]
MLLIEGLSEYTKHSALGAKAALEEFLSTLEEIVNHEIFGDKINEAQWICPTSYNKLEIGQITMSNVRTRKMMKKIDLLLDLCIPNNTRKESEDSASVWTITRYWHYLRRIPI